MKLSLRIPLAFAALASLPLAALAWFAFDRGRSSLEEHAQETLAATSAIKQDAVEAWLAHALHMLQMITDNSQFVADATAAAGGDPSSQHQEALRSAIQSLLSGERSRFISVELRRALDGAVLVAARPPNAATYNPADSRFDAPLREPAVEGISYSAAEKAPVLTVSAPVEDSGGELIAVLSGELNFDELSEILSQTYDQTETSETFLVDANGLVVTTRRLVDDPPFTTVLETAPVQRCSESGTSFTGRYIDYRGESVLGHAVWLPSLNVCLISKTDTSEAFADVNSLRTAVTVAGGATAIVSVLLGLAFANSLTRPLGRLRDGAVHLSAGGNGIRLPESSRDELGQLAAEFNKMADAIAERQAALETMNHELALSREAAEVASKAKTDFISRMSHEFRTPLNVVLGFGQVMQLDELSPEQENAVRHILTAGRHLLGLIDDVLDVSRVEAGRLRLSVEPISVAAVVEESVDLVRQLAAARNIELLVQSSCAPDLLMAADRRRINQVLLNLLSNAIKYNRDGGRVAVSCDRHAEGSMRISVTDTGRGIPPDKQARLFHPFDRLDAEEDAGTEGTGLGLYLARSLTEAMGGEIGVESVEGEGSTFWLSMPVAATNPVQAAIDAPADEVASSGESRRDGAVVLYIEDNLANVELMEALVARLTDARLITAMQGSIGLQMARDHLPDMIILDLHLPDVSGEAVLKALRGDAQTAGIPIVIASADASNTTITRLRASGAQAFLTKPLNVRKLVTIVDRFTRPSAIALPAGSGPGPAGSRRR